MFKFQKPDGMLLQLLLKSVRKMLTNLSKLWSSEQVQLHYQQQKLFEKQDTKASFTWSQKIKVKNVLNLEIPFDRTLLSKGMGGQVPKPIRS